MKIAITGSSGSVGSAIVKYVLQQGHTVLGIDIVEPPLVSRSASFSFMKIDMTNYDSILDSLRGCDALCGSHIQRDDGPELTALDSIHAAAMPSPGKVSDATIHNTFVFHLGGTRQAFNRFCSNVSCSYNALRAAAEVGIKRVTQLSSINAIGSVYTPFYRKYHYLPLDETHPYEPADPYALSKMSGSTL